VTTRIHRLVPASIDFVPGPEAIAAALALARATVDARQIEACVPPFIVFFDCGGNLPDVACPSCKADASAGWDNWMDASCAVDTGFAFTERVMPCCGATVSLETLLLDPPCAFGRFAIEIVDTMTTLSPDRWTRLRRKLETILGCPLTQIDADY
jgi:hypothetical protein